MGKNQFQEVCEPQLVMFKVNSLQCKVASSLEGSIGLDLQPADFITLVSCLTTGSLAHDDDRDDDNGGKSNDNIDEVMAFRRSKT